VTLGRQKEQFHRIYPIESTVQSFWILRSSCCSIFDYTIHFT